MQGRRGVCPKDSLSVGTQASDAYTHTHTPKKPKYSPGTDVLVESSGNSLQNIKITPSSYQ